MYQIKLYDKGKVFKKTINPKAIKNKISFTKQINGGLGQFSLFLDVKFGIGNTYNFGDINYTFIQGDIIEIYYFQNTKETLIYVGYIEEIIDNIGDFQELELKINGLASLFKRLVYNVSGNYTSNINQDTFTTITTIKNFANISYNYFNIIGNTTGIIANYDLNYNNCFDLINNINELSANYYWYLDNYDLIFKEKPTTATHTFTLQKDIVELNIENDTLDLVNYLILTYKSGTVIYQDSTSITTYGKREKYISNTQIANLTSANEFGNKYIADNKEPKQRITLRINNKYIVGINALLEDFTNNLSTYIGVLNSYSVFKNIHNIKPGETCKIRNINKSLNDNLLITKINYNQDIIVLELEQTQNFIGLIKQ